MQDKVHKEKAQTATWFSRKSIQGKTNKKKKKHVCFTLMKLQATKNIKYSWASNVYL